MAMGMRANQRYPDLNRPGPDDRGDPVRSQNWKVGDTYYLAVDSGKTWKKAVFLGFTEVKPYGTAPTISSLRDLMTLYHVKSLSDLEALSGRGERYGERVYAVFQLPDEHAWWVMIDGGKWDAKTYLIQPS